MSDEKKQGDENWRYATAEDVAEIFKTGKPKEARFRNQTNLEWEYSTLTGWSQFPAHAYFYDRLGSTWRLCQVYVEPAPTRSPKYGCRMLEDNEEPMPGDFINWGAGWNELTAPMFPSLAVATPSWFCRPIKEPVEEIGKNVGPVTIEAFSPVTVETKPELKQHRTPTLADLADGPVDPLRVYVASVKQERRDALMASIAERPVPKGFRLLGDEPRLASDGYWSLSCKDWLVIGDRIEIANRDKWPAIRLEVDEAEPAGGWKPTDEEFQYAKDLCRVPVDPIQAKAGLIMQIRLPFPASVLGKLGDMLEKHYPGSTMRQVGGFLVFEEPIES